MEPKQEGHENITQLSSFRMILISLVHLTIGIGIVSLSTYIPAELRYLNWEPYIIAYIVGFVTIFELSRMVAGYFGDTYPIFGSYRKVYVLIGFAISSAGFIIIGMFINSLIVIIGMIFYTIGSAIMSTMVDAYLIDESISQNKNKIAAITQFFRLAGFAVGGILGVALYGRLSFQIFYLVLLMFHILGSFVSIIFITEKNYKLSKLKDEVTSSPHRNNLDLMIQALRSKPVIAMSIFLILYPIGLFAQDAILEPFAIDYLSFDREGIGRMASIWGTTTLIFIPIAMKIEKIIGRIPTIFSGLSIASISLLLIATLALNEPGSLNSQSILSAQRMLYLSLAFFGIGLGLMTTPGTAMMFDVCSLNKKFTASLIAYFGVLVTLSRSFASFLSGFILQFSSNYSLLFTLEAIILFSALFPLIYVSRQFKIIGIETSTEIRSIPDI